MINWKPVGRCIDFDLFFLLLIGVSSSKKGIGKGRWKSVANLSEAALEFVTESDYVERLQGKKPAKESISSVCETLLEKKVNFIVKKYFMSLLIDPSIGCSDQGQIQSRRGQGQNWEEEENGEEGGYDHRWR